MTVPKMTRSKKKQRRLPSSLLVPLCLTTSALAVVIALLSPSSSPGGSAAIDVTASIEKRTAAWNGETVPLVPPSSSTKSSTLPMPAMGYGTCCRPTAMGDAIYKSTLLYLNNGGRHIDTAMSYGNHPEVGRAVKDSGVPRDLLWITSKIAVGKVRGEDATLDAVRGILDELETGYLDLCLIHSPKRGRDETIRIWRGLIKARDDLGLVRSIGVSNFNRAEIVDLTEITGVAPQLNQIQFHPWTPDEWKELVRWQGMSGIATTAYTSLGGSRFHSSDGGGASWPPVLTELAKKYGATEAQVLLRRALDRGVAVIPGATSEEHIRENLNVSRFHMTKEETKRLEGTEVPKGWWDRRRGAVKFKAEEAGEGRAWVGDHTVKWN